MIKFLWLFLVLIFYSYSCANPSADSLCKDNPCKDPHKTVCKVRGSSFVCLCDEGYRDKYGICIKDEEKNPCNPNPCEMEHRTICNADNGFPLCLCDSGYHDEEGNCVSNKKNVTCKSNETLPKNSHEIVSEVEIEFENNQWQEIPYCEIECDEGYSKNDNGECVSEEVDPCANINCPEHSSCDAGNCLCDSGYHKDGETCTANTKNVDCNDSNVPANATAVISQVEITYTEGGGWSTPEDCEWACNNGYHREGETCVVDALTCEANQHEENGVCVSNTKTVDCNAFNVPENATAVISQVEITYTQENGWTLPADCEWNCNNGYHKEGEGCAYNTKTVDCNDSNVPDNATKINSQVEITYTEGGGWSIPADCEWTCNINYHKENDMCLSNTKMVDCNDTDIPDNATAVISQVEVTYTEGNGWSMPADCEWTCNDGYHEENNACVEDALTCEANQHEENGVCVSNTKTVPCRDVTPQNATTVNVDVEITYTEGSGWSTPADCDWNCNDGYHREGDVCIENGTIACDDEFESNNTYADAALIEDANARDSQYTNLTICEGDEDWYKIQSEANSGLEIDVNYTHVQDECDIDVKLYKMVDGELTQVDSSVYSTGRETVYVRNTVTSETYYVKVYGYKSNCENPYTLTANIFNNCIDDEENYSVAEQDDVLEEAKPFNLYTSYNRMICDYDDDWYTYYFNAGDSIRITLNLVNADGDLDVFLYGPDGSSLKGTYGTNDTEIIDYDITQDGNYYIKVRGWGFGDSSNSYTLRVIKKEVYFDTGEQNYALEDDACKVFLADFSDQVEIDNALIKNFEISKLLITHEYLSDLNIYVAIGDEDYFQIWTRSTDPSATLDNNRDDDTENDADIDLINRVYDNFNNKVLGDKKLRLKVCDDYSGDTGNLKRLFFIIKYDKQD